MSAQVSICLPTLNSIRFLAERLESIRHQTFTDWELIAVDSHSDDGTFEALEKFSSEEPRVRITQAPKDGIYPNFNRGIQQAGGRYVYIATSDDTMAPDCLEKMVAALEENPDCDLAHCPMKVIDETGDDGLDWWSSHSLFARSSGDFLNIRHRRVAPCDGVLCLLGDNIYSSVTQLLIRRTLFDRIGYYQTDWGSLGDFHWNLRAGLAASAVHVPDTWGGWRMHGNQATAGVRLGSAAHQAKIDSMIDDVILNLEKIYDGLNQDATFPEVVGKARDLRLFLREHASHSSVAERVKFLILQALKGRRAAWRHLASVGFGRKRWPLAAPESVQSWFAGDVLVPLPGKERNF